MSTYLFWGQLVAPIMLFAVLAIFAAPVTVALKRWMPDGRLKKLLLDRSLQRRRPWIGWVAAFLCYAIMFGMVWTHPT